jgi:hypothetical protein
MNLIGFPHYTCGGLLCDIFNKTFSTVGSHGGINSFTHQKGKIGDSDSIFSQYDTQEFENTILSLGVPANAWIGTHCWPDRVNLEIFDKVLLITTTTARSKLYRWIRAYHHYYLQSQPWLEQSGQARIDKERETAKKYLEPYLPIHACNVINIEFSEIVEGSCEFRKLVSEYDFIPHLERWKKINEFLYDPAIWNSDAFLRFYEADYEVQLKKFYQYE